MRSQAGLTGALAAALLASASPANAAWNNVFQLTCNNCGTPAPVVAAYPDPCPPQQQCTTRYVQRSYYQPVTTYRPQTTLQPVTTMQRSYYYEATTSMRYSCAYDPCTCRYQQVATPVTSYQLRSRCCPVTSYLQRTCMVPVTTQQEVRYWVPQTTCCNTTTGAPITQLPPGASVIGDNAAPPPPAATTNPPPGDEAVPAPPGTESRDTSRSKLDRNPGFSAPGKMPGASDSSIRPEPVRPPAVRLDRIASRGGPKVEGRVLGGDNEPRAAVRLLFVSADSKDEQERATTDEDGAFRLNLTGGGWLVYTYNAQNRPVFSRRIEVPATRDTSVTLVQR
jgi:hypothetical protein